MIMANDPKRIAGLIVAGKASDKDGEKKEEKHFDVAEEDADVDVGLLSAAEEVQKSFNSSPAALAKALQNFFEIAQGMGAPEEEEESNGFLG